MTLSISITDLEKGATEKVVPINAKIFDCEFKEPLVHQIITAYLAGGRAGTRGQKTRTEVRGGGKKPWKQKGTGQARAGTTRSPIWRGGGVTFAAKTQDYTQKVNKKMYTAAMRAIFSELLRQNRLILLENLQVISHKTREFIQQMKKIDLSEVLIITDKVDENLYLATRNLFKVNVRNVEDIDPVSLIRFEKVLLTVPALKQIEEMLG
ncbi:MAG: 50S ribosomal protein L4 [Gammaproteobacteria bacterium GWE2_37_16]|nr:MAG: 50S ribosomal protein L4 [Gammaproteobacteria bacterium GWE2_37_16]